MSFVTKSFDQILADLIAYTVANSSQITDLNVGSVLRSFAEGMSLSIEELYIGTYLGFKRYLETIQENNYDFPRKEGTKAITTVIFSRAGTAGNVTIPVGTRVGTATDLKFITLAEGVISGGSSDSGAIAVEATVVGVAYNVSSSSIVVLVDTIDGVTTVNNANASAGGIDIESVYDYKKRFQVYIEGLGKCNNAGLRSGVLSVEGVTSASIVEHIPPVGNVNAHVYIDDGSATGVSTEMVDIAQAVIDGDGTVVSPGYRASGVNVIVDKPSIVTQNIVFSIDVLAGVDSDQINADLNTAVVQYLNNLGVGADIVYNELVSAVMSVFGVTDCNVTTPSANVSVTSTQVPRVGTITIS